MEEKHEFTDKTETPKTEFSSVDIKKQVAKIIPKEKKYRLLNTNYDDDEYTPPGGSGQEEWESRWD